MTPLGDGAVAPEAIGAVTPLGQPLVVQRPTNFNPMRGAASQTYARIVVAPTSYCSTQPVFVPVACGHAWYTVKPSGPNDV
jgi:hypothetical protein